MSTDKTAPLTTAGERLDDDFRRWRDARLADPAFRRSAAESPVLGPIASRNAKKLFDLTAGFVYSQILKACVDLDLFAKLADGPRTAGEVATATALPPDAARKLLDAATALDLVELRRDGRYGLGMLGAALHGEPGVKAMIAHHDMLYADLADPVALLRGEGGATKLSKFWSYAGGAPTGGLGDNSVADYSELMNESQSFVAEDVLDAFSFGDRNGLLDLGGGQGAFVAAVAKRWPHLELALFDLPAVADRAEKRFAEAGLADRVKVHGGDLFTDPAPQGADVVSLVRVLHDHDDDRALALLRTAHAALAPGGELLIAEPLAGMQGAKRVGHAYLGFYLLAMGSGEPRTSVRLGELLAKAGFWNVRSRLTRGSFPLAVVTAKRAGEGPVWRN